jgi:hypothetical protein
MLCVPIKFSRGEASCGEGDHFDLLTVEPVEPLMMSSMLAPASGFSKIPDTGIRVPFKTRRRLTLPGTLSTAGHCELIERWHRADLLISG